MGKQLLVKSTDHIHHILFRYPWLDIFSYSMHTDPSANGGGYLSDKQFFDCGKYYKESYKHECGNEHHYKTEYLYYGIMPDFLKELGIIFKKDDYTEKWHPTTVPNENILQLIPKTDFKFKIDIFHKIHLEGNYIETLSNIGKPKITTDARYPYHDLFVGTHTCCQIINETINHDKKICISGDSMISPIIPILACYYKEVVFLDNRSGESFSDFYENKVFDDIVFQFYDPQLKQKTLGINLF